MTGLPGSLSLVEAMEGCHYAAAQPSLHSACGQGRSLGACTPQSHRWHIQTSDPLEQDIYSLKGF